jgi:hypothetical protein
MLRVVILLASIVLLSIGNLFGGEKPPKKSKVIETNIGEVGASLEIYFMKDNSFDKPTFAFWIEDTNGKYIETLYVTNYLATGTYKHARLGEGEPYSKRGPAKRPSSLPYWLHKRNIRADGITYLPTPDKPVADAITGATPKSDFLLKTIVKSVLPRKFNVMLEINQAWDYNEYWNENKFPAEFDYTYSCQPAIVYSATIDLDNPKGEVTFSLIGHAHYSGKNGDLYEDISTLTTAKTIVKEVTVRLK